MGAHLGKLECILLPCQSGKTSVMIKTIQTYKDLAMFGACESVDILISANNRSLVTQTSVRMKTELFDESKMVSDDQIIGKVFNWQSGLKKTNISERELAWEILDDKVEMVVCCAHKQRLEYIVKLINRLTSSAKFTKKINIWIDEADVSITLWAKHEQAIISNPAIACVKLVSATFDSIIKKYGRIPVMGKEKTHADCYLKIQECTIKTEDIISVENGAYGYLKAVFEKYGDELCLPGIRLFAPGDITQESHNQIAEFLAKKGFVVVVLNGSRKIIIVPGRSEPHILDGLVDDEDSSEEIGKQIAKIYTDNDYARFPFAITGHKCIGRGITFQSNDFLFDYGIIPFIADKDNAYQTTARVVGNIKDLVNYKVPTLIMTSKMKNTVINKENVAINIARMVFDGELQGDDGLVGSADIKKAGGVTVDVDPMQFDWPSKNGANGGNNYELFATKEAVEARKRELNPSSRSINFKRDEQGFYICDGGKMDRLTFADISALNKVTSHLPESKNAIKLNKASIRAYVYYEIGETDPEKCLYALRWLRRIAEKPEIL